MKTLLILLAMICQQPIRMNGLEKAAITALSREKAQQYRTMDNLTRRRLVWSDLVNEAKSSPWYDSELNYAEKDFLLYLAETAAKRYDFEPQPVPQARPAPRYRATIPPQTINQTPRRAASPINGVVYNGPATTQEFAQPKAWYDVIIAGQRVKVWGFLNSQGTVTFIGTDQSPQIQAMAQQACK